MKKNLPLIVIALIFCIFRVNGQGATCSDAEPFCTDSGTTFPASINTTADPNNTYGCLATQPNPAWYYLEIGTPGLIEITLTNSNNLDIDFIVYGPFPDLTTAIGTCGNLNSTEDILACVPILGSGCPQNPAACSNVGNACVTGNGIDCSYDPQTVEIATIPNGQVGEVYIFLITNFSNGPTDISLSQTGGTGATDCSIIAPTSPCDCLSGVSCDGATFPDQNTAVTALNTVTATSSFCYDLTTQTIPGGDGNTYQFCYLYTHASTEPFFAFSGTSFFTGPNSTNCVANPSTTTLAAAYDLGACGTPLSIVNVTSDGWGVYAATQGTTYELCLEITGDTVDCATEDITDVCILAHPFTPTCTLFGGNVGTPSTFDLCFEDLPYTLTSTNPVTSPATPDVVWAVWVLSDPNGLTGVPAGPIPPDQDPLNGDPNFLGFLPTAGSPVTSTLFFDGAILYFAPMVADLASQTYDPLCTGLAPGYTIYMNPPLSFNTAITNCNATIDLLGGYPTINTAVDYTWEVVAPSGTITTGMGTPIIYNSMEDGDHIVSIVNDGLALSQCDLPNFDTLSFYGCNCMANAGLFSTPLGTTICNGDAFSLLGDGSYSGSFEDGGANDQAPIGDGDFFNGFVVGVYSAPPTLEFATADPNLLFTTTPAIPATPGGPVTPYTITNTSAVLAGAGLLTNTTYYFTTVYSFDNDNGILGVDTDNDGVVDCADVSIGSAVPVVFLDTITATFTQSCNLNGTVSIVYTIAGGLPAFDPTEQFTITGDGPGGMVFNNGMYTIPNHPANTAFSITVTDANACVATFGGMSLPVPMATVTSTNITCGGTNDGTATVSTTGGVTPYTIVWSNNETTPTITGLAPNTYNVTVSDVNGCSSTGSVVISTAPPLNASAAFTPVLCNGGSSGTATVAITGGTPPFGYNWQPSGQTIATATGLSAGTHNVTVTDASGCNATALVLVTEPSGLGVTTNSSDPSCFGSNDGSYTALGNGGTMPYSYLWSNGATTPGISNLTAGLYCVTVTDNNNCSAVACNTLTNPPVLTNTLTVTGNASCNGSTDGSISANVGGGTTPYTFVWNHNPTLNGPIASNLNPGTYNLTVSDANGCIQTATATINASITIATNGFANDANCFGESSGSVILMPTGSPATPYVYNWNPNVSTASTATGLTAGTYEVTVTDGNGCFTTAAYNVNQPIQISATFTVNLNISCAGSSDGSLLVNPTGGSAPYSYQWGANSGNQTTQLANNLPSGIHTVTITDANGCSLSAGTVLADPTPISLTSSVNNNVLCNGLENGSATITPNGGSPIYSYQWDLTAGNQTTATATGLAAGPHDVTVTDMNGCSISTSVIITEPTALNPSISINNNISCFGLSDGSATANAVGGVPGYTYLWSNSANNQITQTAINLPAGLHTVTVTDANGCTETASTSLNSPPQLNLIVTIVNGVTCFGGNDGTIQANPSGGTPFPGGIYNYQWSTNANGQTSQTASNLTSGTYSVTVTDQGGCTITGSVVLNSSPQLIGSVSLDNNVSCNGGADGQATATATGGTPFPGSVYGYEWSANANSQITPTAINLPAGLYNVTITDALGCSIVETITITQPLPLTVSLTNTNDPLCFGDATGSATALPVGGTQPYNYFWSVSGETTQTASALISGTHVVFVSDANGCQTSASLTLGQPSELQIISINGIDPLCTGESNGSATVIHQGGTPPITYLWSNAQVTQTAYNLDANSYTVTVIDGNGCTSVGGVSLVDPTPITYNITTTETSCSDASSCDAQATLTVSGGVGGYTIVWDNGSVGLNAQFLCQGPHFATITDGNGCTEIVSFSINAAPALLPGNVVATPVNCYGGNDGFILVEPVGGTPPYNFNWYDPVGLLIMTNSGPSSTVTNLSAGVYTVIITDVNNCTIAPFPITLNEPIQALTTDTIAVSDASCYLSNDGTITVVPAGGTPSYTYQWDGNANGQTTQTALNLSNGTYAVTITDANGCSIIESATVNQPSALQATAVSDSTVCFGDASGSIAIPTTQGGVPPYLYSIDGINFYPDTLFSGLESGNYTIYVEDANGCQFMLSEYLYGPPEILLEIFSTAVDNVIIMGDSTTLNPQSNIDLMDSTLVFTWTPPNDLSCTDCLNPVASPFETTTYTLTVEDTTACSATNEITITVDKQRHFFVPNVFTPNGDNINDIFYPFGSPSISNVRKMLVYDRWGELMFQNENFSPDSPTNGWDGTFKGLDMDAGVFVYYIEIEFLDGLVEEFTGDVTLVR